MPIVVNSPFSGKPVKVRDEDVGRAIRDEEKRIFYVVQRASGEGFYGAPTRKGSEKDEQRYDNLMNKVDQGESFAKQQLQTAIHDARGKKRKLSPARVIAFLLLLAVIGFIVWYSMFDGQQIINQYLNEPNDTYEEIIIEEEIVVPAEQAPSRPDAETPNSNDLEERTEGNVSWGKRSVESVALASPGRLIGYMAATDRDGPDDDPGSDQANQKIDEGEEAADDAAFVVLPSGVKYWIDVKGDEDREPAKAGDWVEIAYRAWLPGGVPVGASEAEKPVGFVLWSGDASRGFDEAINGMYPGERRTLVLPPEVMRGDTLIEREDDEPIDNTLMCEVHLISAKPGIDIDVLRQGVGRVTKPGDKVELAFIARVVGEDEPFMSSDRGGGYQPLVFVIGDRSVIRGLDLAVTGMAKDETRRVWIPSYLGYGEKGFKPLIPENANLEYVITLRDLSKKPEDGS
ncbi:FK506-binding protein [Poriferisphaera corsica]|uniref:peptidylprolyl isomerase n=1 Tax=Poriferisphaera corsica TaxID=2528020 RepID=A0A517YZ12_9BACT|nr:FKBP-type peptidyl-prolyl cis-trans isomerase [Poriferisphaera corsica]QDU35464.1 FK506-binding protein [Poriferisphaera corsica]